jgi:hypothetical protein
MLEIFATIYSEHGTRTVPTGDCSYYQDILEKKILKLKRKYPNTDFFIEVAEFQDGFNAY